MHRWILACVVIALMAQGAWADGQEKVLEKIPSYSQGNTGWCSWVSAQMVLDYYGYSVSPQVVASKTFELAGQKWGGKDKDGLPWRYYRSYGDAIRSLSNNNLIIEEIDAQNKDDVLYKTFDAIDHGYPIILLSGGPWLYDATDLPELSWIEFPPESSWPSGDHASVIVGYSLKEEMNNFITSGPLTFFTNLLAYPPVIKIHDPATAAIGVGAYWVSYSKLFDKTIGYPSVTRLLIVKLSSKDDVQPIVQAFKISPISISIGESFAIDYTVSSNSGSGLKQVELWRKDESSDWHEIKPSNTLAGETDPLTGSFMDSPSAPGKYWYGVHVVDNAGNWNDERNSNTNGQPIGFEPLEVQVNPKPEVKGQQGYTRTNEYYDNSTATTCTPGSVSAVCSSIDTCVDCDGKCRPSGTAIGVDWVCNQGKWNYQHITRTNEYWDNSTATTCAPGSAKATCFSADTCVGCDGKCYSSGTDIGRGWACNKGKWDYQPKSLSDLGTYRTTFDRVLYDSDALMKIGNKGYNKGIQLYRGGEGILDFLGHTENFTAYFNLNRGYSGLIGLVGLDDKTANSVANVEVVFIGDNVELHRAILIPGELPSEVNIDVSGIQRLTVEAAYSTESAYIDLIDMDLQK